MLKADISQKNQSHTTKKTRNVNQKKNLKTNN